jgi:hypothetical protein
MSTHRFSIGPHRAHRPRLCRAILATALLATLSACDDSPSGPPTPTTIEFRLTAETGGGEAGRSLAVRAYYLRNGTQQVDLVVDPATFAVSSAATTTEDVSVNVRPCFNDSNREGAADGECRVHFTLTLRAANGTTVSQDENVIMVTRTTGNLVPGAFELASGALVPALATVDFEMLSSGQLPTATPVAISSSTALPPGALSATIEYHSGTGWLSATVPAGQSSVTLVPTTASLAPGRYEAMVRVTSAWMFTPAEIRVSFTVPQPPKTVTITGAGNGTGLVLVTPAGASCTSTAGQMSGICVVPSVHGSTVTLTPAAAVGSGFAGWSGACQGTAPCTLVMDQDRAVTATFTLLKRELTVDAGGSGSGSVTSAPAGISCTATSGQESGDCAEQFDHGTQVTLTATPVSATSTFAGWSGACSGTGACVVTMTEARSVSATFTLIPRSLSVSIGGGGTGTVTSSPAGIACTMTGGQQSGTCSTQFDHGTQVTLTATPGTDMTFTGWTGDCTGTGACTVTMDQARAVTAVIVAPSPGLVPLTITQAGNNAGSISFEPSQPGCSFVVGGGASCTREFPTGTVVKVTAGAAGQFGQVSLNGACSTGGVLSTSCQFTMDGPRSLTATFTRPSTQVTVVGSGTGSGTVRSSDPWINCTIAAGQTSGTCSSNYFGQQSVFLTPTAAPGSVFGGWIGCPDEESGSVCVVPTLGNATVTAIFNTTPAAAEGLRPRP